MRDLHRELERFSPANRQLAATLNGLKSPEPAVKVWWVLVDRLGNVLKGGFKDEAWANRWARRHGLTQEVRAMRREEAPEDYLISLEKHRWERQKTHKPLDTEKKYKEAAKEVSRDKDAPIESFWKKPIVEAAITRNKQIRAVEARKMMAML